MRRHRATAIVLAAALTAASVAAAEPAKGDKYALLVGVRQYSEARELRPLAYTERDVTDLAQTLRDNGYKPENVVLMTQTFGSDQLRFLPMKKRIHKELALLLDGRTADDTVLVAFAGHGVQFKDDSCGYFCPADAELGDKETLLSLAEVYHEMEGCKAGLKVLLVDACRNDPLADSSRAPARVDLESVTRPPAPTKEGGVVAFFSCSEKEKAYEADKFKHGVFFHYVIEGLQGAAGGDDVTVLALGAYVSRRVHDFVRAEYGTNQTPELTGAARGSMPLVQTTDDVRACRRGQTRLEKKDYDQAITEFSEAIRLNPKFATAYNNRGVGYKQKGELEKAIADYDQAIRLDPKHTLSYLNRGIAYKAQKEYGKAIDDFTEVMRLDPRCANAFINRGNAYYARGDLDNSAADYTAALRIAPDLAFVYAYRAHVHNDKKEYDQAIADCAEALRRDPANEWGRYQRGVAYGQMKEYDKAIDDFTQVIRLESKVASPMKAAALLSRGGAEAERGDETAAIADFVEVVQLTSSTRAVLDAVVNHGAYLYNGPGGSVEKAGANPQGCYSFYRDVLKALRPTFRDRKDLLEEIDSALDKAAAESEARKRAFMLRKVIDDLWAETKPDASTGKKS